MARSPRAFNAGFLNPEVRNKERGAPGEPEGLELDAGADLAALGFRVEQRDFCPLTAPAANLLRVDFAAEGGVILGPLLERTSLVLPNLRGC